MSREERYREVERKSEAYAKTLIGKVIKEAKITI
jgi:hypothetical protein